MFSTPSAKSCSMKVEPRQSCLEGLILHWPSMKKMPVSQLLTARAFMPTQSQDWRFPEVCLGSRAAVADRRMAQPVYLQLRKYPSVPALTLRARTVRHGD